MLYSRCTGIYKFGNNTYPRRIRRRSNLGHIFRGKSASYGRGNTVTMFRPWSPIATGNHLDRAEKIPKVAQTTGTVDFFDPRLGISGPTSRELPHAQIFMNDGANPLT